MFGFGLIGFGGDGADDVRFEIEVKDVKLFASHGTSAHENIVPKLSLHGSHTDRLHRRMATPKESDGSPFGSFQRTTFQVSSFLGGISAERDARARRCSRPTLATW